jgi:ABC-type multidrug transport system ATPase subunit
MIEIDGLTKRYGDKTAVDGLSFVVEPGVVTGFLGPNGAGKSTTTRVIAGLDRPTSGTVRVNGKHYDREPGNAPAAFPGFRHRVRLERGHRTLTISPDVP